MKRSRMTAATLGCALVVAGATASVTPASAYHDGRYGGRYHHHRGGGWSPGAAAAVGIIGGLALGSIIASGRPAYGYGYGYRYGYGYDYGYPSPVHAWPRYHDGFRYGGGHVVVPRHRRVESCRVIRRQVRDGFGGGPRWESLRICPY